MGWFGHSIYHGDETQTCHITFVQNSGYKVKYDYEIFDCLHPRKTVLTEEMKDCLVKNINNVLQKMPKLKRSKNKNIFFKDEYDAIEWQMLLSLFIDNKLSPPKIIKDNGILATEYLMQEHALEFNKPHLRRACLKRFLKKAVNIT